MPAFDSPHSPLHGSSCSISLPYASLPIVRMVLYYKQRACRPHEDQAQTPSLESVSELVDCKNAQSKDNRDRIHSQTSFYKARTHGPAPSTRASKCAGTTPPHRAARHSGMRRMLVRKHDSGGRRAGRGGGRGRAINYASDYRAREGTWRYTHTSVRLHLLIIEICYKTIRLLLLLLLLHLLQLISRHEHFLPPCGLRKRHSLCHLPLLRLTGQSNSILNGHVKKSLR
jgi:hypothetical protein